MSRTLLSWTLAADRVPFLAWLTLGAVVAACTRPGAVAPSTGDVVRDLRAAVAHAEAGLPLARLACQAIRHDDERAACLAVAARVESALGPARDALARADACAGQDDEPACVALAVDGANVLLRALQGQPLLPAASASAPAPSASASHGP